MIFVKIRIWRPEILSMKIDIYPKNFFIYATLRVDPECVIRNIIALRNLEIAFKNRFRFLPPGRQFHSVGR